jgi:hypothetical protein
MNKYATVGGILSIVSGALGILSGLSVIFMAFFISWLISSEDAYVYNSSDIAVTELSNILRAIYGSMGVFFILVGILALIGGIFAVRRKVWGLALAGAIASVMTFFPVGIVSIIFTSMAKPEFEANVISTTPPPLSSVLPLPPQT